MRLRHRSKISIALVSLLACTQGCSRHRFRQQADQEVQCIVAEKGGFFDNGSIQAPADSRLADPNPIDCPPIPPDDPQSHQLMHCVDGKSGYPHWDKYGRIANVEPTLWTGALPTNNDGVVSLDLRDSVRVARLHSREYQNNLETLYISALDVSFERFRFDHQFFAGNVLEQDFRGRRVGARSDTRLGSAAGFRKLSASGGQLVVGLANSLVWDSWGSGNDLFTSVIDLSLVQPLLRLGGRARVLESLTQSERNLLANVRQMQQFRQGFYVNIVTGRTSGSGPALNNRVGQAGLGLIAGTPSNSNPTGYLGLLQAQQRIRNQDSNIAALRDSLAQLNAAFEANRISSRLQVDQARQALLNAQSSQLTAKAVYDTRVDDFKVDLGLPPELPLEIRDALLDRFILIHPDLTRLQNELSEVLLDIRQNRDDPSMELVVRSLGEIDSYSETLAERVTAAEDDLAALMKRLPERKVELAEIAGRVRELNADVDRRVYDESVLMKRIEFLQERLPQIHDDLEASQERFATLGDDASKKTAKADWKELIELATNFSDLLLELSLVHAEIRLQGITLPPIDITTDEALASARLNRLDWMNVRANLVDTWRRIEFFANDLRSNLSVRVDGEIRTRPDNVLDFDDDRSRIQMGIEFDAPIARLGERNDYRESLIAYQRARRDYMLFEDRVTQSLRNTIRIIQLSQINLEVRRAAVQVAIAQVDIARLRLNPPVKPNQASRTSPTAARDLVSALTDLLDAQNDLLNVWVSYEMLRVLLDFEMGTMQLDPTGVWIDTGKVQAENSPGLEKGDALGDAIPVNSAAETDINSPLRLDLPNSWPEPGMIEGDE